MLTILNPVQIDQNPKIIVRISTPNSSNYNSEIRTHDQALARVYPKTGEDVGLIRMLRHGIDYFAPAVGDGLYVKPELLFR